MFSGRIYNRNCSKALDGAFDASGWGDAHTWVNPKLDLIFLSCMSPDLNLRYAPPDVEIFWTHCKLERTKLERVGAMIHNNHITPFLFIVDYTALKELVIYITYPNANRTSRKLEDDGRTWDEAVLGKSITEDLQLEREAWNVISLSPDIIPSEGQSAQKVPRIQVSQEIHWYRNERMRRQLKVAPLTKGGSVLFCSPGREEFRDIYI